jgi:hypothetical protein
MANFKVKKAVIVIADLPEVAVNSRRVEDTSSLVLPFKPVKPASGLRNTVTVPQKWLSHRISLTHSRSM